MLEIPLVDLRTVRRQFVLPSVAYETGGVVVDALDRPLRDLRISLIDRCNFRCTYCMPRETFGPAYPFLARDELLTFEEINRLAAVFLALGVRKIRLSGGEPLLRKGIENLVYQLASLTTIDHRPIDLAMTTNGSLLKNKAQSLAEAGLCRINVSLDALHQSTFERLTDTHIKVNEVLEGIAAAAAAGISTIKINMVVKRGVNDHEVLPMARHFRHSGHVLRFIEFMDVGSVNGWQLASVVPSSEILAAISSEFPLVPVVSGEKGAVAQQWRYADGAGEIGVISSVTQPFCGDCSRARLSADGKLFNCLFAQTGMDVRQLLRQTHTDESVASAIAANWQRRADRYSELRSLRPRSSKIEMSYIGG